jgi:hypothetical protein
MHQPRRWQRRQLLDTGVGVAADAAIAAAAAVTATAVVLVVVQASHLRFERCPSLRLGCCFRTLFQRLK